MALVKLDVLSVRNIRAANILPSPGINLIVGPNAGGKSSLLEALFILGRARSFRTTHIKQAIHFDEPHLTVSAQNLLPGGSIMSIGIQVDSKTYQIRIDAENREKADLAYALPMQLIHPKSYLLLDAGPQMRREFLDWGIFNRHKHFLSYWRNYGRALQQRNTLLKSGQLNQIASWDKEIAEFGGKINHYRQHYLQTLKPVFLDIATQFLNVDDITIRFYAGWDDSKDLERVLKEDRDRDLRYGFTQSGPHRADFIISVNGRIAKDYLSRGQQKLLVLALILSQIRLLNHDAINSCCILIDDLTAELDTANRLKLLEYLFGLGCQTFMTATCLADFGDLSTVEHYKLFHVEHGCIKQL